MTYSKILAIKLRSMGDTALMTAPVIELIKAFPQSEIDLVVHADWSDLLFGIPGLHQIWTVQNGNGRMTRFFQLTGLARQFRKKKYDCVINFHASPSSAKLALSTGAKHRSIHFHNHNEKNRYSNIIIPGKGNVKPIIERDMDAIRGLGLHIPAGRSPQIFLQKTEELEAAELLHKMRLPQPLLGISLGASRPTKCWPIERFASLAIEWCQKEQGGVLAIVGPQEGHVIHEFLQSVDNLLEGSFRETHHRAKIRAKIATTLPSSVRRMASILSQLAVLVGNDSGPKHVAIALNTPTVTLFGPEDPFEWHPYPQDRHPYLFIDNLECRKDQAPQMPAWCGLQKCLIEEHKCMRLIGVDLVLNHCQRICKR